MVKITVQIEVSKLEQERAERWASDKKYDYTDDKASLYADYLISRHYIADNMPSYQASLS